MIESTVEPLFHITSLPKHWTIADVNSNFVISNANLEIESFSLYESICDADRLDFGRCNSARVTFTCLNIDLNLINKTFDISFTFEGHPNEPFNVGRFTVIEDKPSPDRKSREVVLQDALYFILNTNYASWYNALNWTGLTLGGFIDSFLTHVGLTADTASRAELVNASMPVEKTLVTNELLGSTILYAVCQIAGCFGVINREGKFKFLYLKSDIEGLYPANDLYPAEDLYPIEPAGTLINDNEYYPPLVYETYITPQITKLHVAENTEDAGTTVGSGDSQYNIMGNFLLMGKSASDITTYCTNTLGAMTKRNYRPYSVSKMGNLCFEIGDPIRMSNDRIAVESYILTRTFTGTQGFTDDISAEGTQDYTTTANTASTSVQQLNSKTLKLKHDVDGVSSELTYQLDPTAGEPGGTHNSYAYQTAQQIGAKVETTTYDNFVNTTYATFVTQTDSALTAKAEKTVGNFTTGFSCTLNTTGHTWYKDNEQVMKIDGNGLTVKGAITAGSTITGSTITGSTVSGGTISGATISGGSLSIMDNNQTGEVYIDQNYIYVKDFRHSNTYVTALQYNQIKFLQGSSQRGLIDGGSYADVFEITGGRSLFLNSDIGGYVSISGNTRVDISAPYIDIWDSKIYVDSFKKMVWHSSLTSTEVNLKDDILDKISSLESRVTALENA